jgi:GH18 family chitinase
MLAIYAESSVLPSCREFPNFDGKTPWEVQHFTLLMQELRAATQPQALLLTVAMRATPNPEQHADIKAIADAVDFINLMTYDYHGAFDWGNYTRVSQACSSLTSATCFKCTGRTVCELSAPVYKGLLA